MLDTSQARASWGPVGRACMLALAACGNGGGDAPADAAPSLDSGPVCTHLQNLKTFHGKALTFGTTNGQAFPGTICIDGRADIACARASTEGDFAMCIPSEGDFAMRLAATGFETTVQLLGPQATSRAAPFTVGDDAYVSARFWLPLGGAYPPTTAGHLVVLVTDAADAPLANAEIAILPSANLDIVYAGDGGLPDTSRTLTSTAGSALIANVPPGDYDLQVTSQGNPSCAYATGGHASPDNSQDARIRVVAGATSIATLRCRP